MGKRIIRIVEEVGLNKPGRNEGLLKKNQEENRNLTKEKDDLTRKLQQKDNDLKKNLESRNSNLVATIVLLSVLGVCAIFIVAAIVSH